jgi:hypothetical protein
MEKNIDANPNIKNLTGNINLTTNYFAHPSQTINDSNFFHSSTNLNDANHFVRKASSSLYEEKTIPRYSEDWRTVEFHLKSAVNCELDIKRVIFLPNLDKVQKFNIRLENMMYVYGWYNFKASSDQNSLLSRLRHRGFDIKPDEGINFTVGSLLNQNEEESYSGEMAYVLCKIIIGRSMGKIRDKKSSDMVSTKPNNYDSILFCSNENASNKSIKNVWGINKSFTYRIFNSDFVLPMYLVTFSLIDVNLHMISNKYVCSECLNKEADFYCYNCECYLCQNCYNHIHGEASNLKNIKNIFDHEKKVLISKLKTGRCGNNHDKEVEYYCTVCKTTICSYCKLVESHSKGEAATHHTIDVYDHYCKLHEEGSDTYKMLESCKKKIEEKIDNIKEKMNVLKDELLKTAKKEIESQFEEESIALRKKSSESLMLHLTIMNELIIIKDSINLVNNYFVKRENFLKEKDFDIEMVYVWNHHWKFLHQIMRNITHVNHDYKMENRELEQIKYNEPKIITFQYEENNSTKELTKEENTKKNKEGKKK